MRLRPVHNCHRTHGVKSRLVGIPRVILVHVLSTDLHRANWTAFIGPGGHLSFSAGPAGGIEAGLAELPRTTRVKWWLRPSGYAFALALAPKDQPETAA